MSRLIRSLLLSSLAVLVLPAFAQNSLLNVSYDVARDFYKDYNPLFQKYWKEKSGESIELKQSHAGSSKQVRAVADGLEADVVTMNQASDVDFLAEKGLVVKDYAKKFPTNASPYTSTMVFIVRKGNPKGLQDWSDLVKPGVQVILPHPKNTGNGRYSYLAAWGYALKQPGGSDKSAQEFVGKLLKNAPLFASGGRDATTTFMQRKIGDVLVSFESEAELIAKEFGKGEFDVVYPSLSILTEFPVAIVDKVVDKKSRRRPILNTCGRRKARRMPPRTTCVRATQSCSRNTPRNSRRSRPSLWMKCSAAGARPFRRTSRMAARSTRFIRASD